MSAEWTPARPAARVPRFPALSTQHLTIEATAGLLDAILQCRSRAGPSRGRRITAATPVAARLTPALASRQPTTPEDLEVLAGLSGRPPMVVGVALALATRGGGM
jgi:hypothetical protein